MAIELTFKPSSKYRAIRFLDDNCIDYESYEQLGTLVVTINDNLDDNTLEQLEDINVG